MCVAWWHKSAGIVSSNAWYASYWLRPVVIELPFRNGMQAFTFIVTRLIQLGKGEKKQVSDGARVQLFVKQIFSARQSVGAPVCLLGKFGKERALFSNKFHRHCCLASLNAHSKIDVCTYQFVLEFRQYRSMCAFSGRLYSSNDKQSPLLPDCC